MYADNTSITFTSNYVEENNHCVNVNLDRISLWLAANKLTVNMTDRISADWF